MISLEKKVYALNRMYYTYYMYYTYHYYYIPIFHLKFTISSALIKFAKNMRINHVILKQKKRCQVSKCEK